MLTLIAIMVATAISLMLFFQVCPMQRLRSHSLASLATPAPLARFLTEKAARHMGSCPNYGPFLGTLNIRCRIIIRTQKRTIILTTPPFGVQGFRDFRVCRLALEAVLSS